MTRKALDPKNLKYGKRRKLLPLAKDSGYTCPPGKEIKKALEAEIRGLPELKEKQYQALDLIVDFIAKDREIEFWTISQKIQCDPRTLDRWIFDERFRRAVEMVMMSLSKANYLFSLATISVQNRKQPKRWMADHLAKVHGYIKPVDINVSQQANIISVVNDDGFIPFCRAESTEAFPADR
jgi:hypothetical protein